MAKTAREIINQIEALRFISVLEATIILDVDKEQIYEWLKSGKLKGYQFGEGIHTTRIRIADMDKFYEEYILRGGWRNANDDFQPTNDENT
jgi:excisionase family DNA binding protein